MGAGGERRKQNVRGLSKILGTSEKNRVVFFAALGWGPVIR